MPWSKDNTIPSLKNKSDKIKEVFAEAANSALARGLSEEEAVFAGLAAVSNYEKKHKIKKEVKEPPLHLKVLLEAIEKRKSEQPPESSKTALEGSETQDEYEDLAKLEKAVKTRSIVSADFDKQDRLVIKFDDGTSITTRPIDIKSYVEQYVSISPQPQVKALEPMTILNASGEPEIVFYSDGEIVTSVVNLEE